MRTFFGGAESRNVRDIVTMLTESTDAFCTDLQYSSTMSNTEMANMQEQVSSSMLNHYRGCFDNDTVRRFEGMLKEDANIAKQMFANNIAEMRDRKYLSENAAPSLVTMTSTIATTMRIPYEAVYHRVYNTRAAENWVIQMEDFEPTIAAPGHEEELLIDALSPFATEKFFHKTEIPITVLESGVTPGAACNKLALTPGLNPLLKVDKDVCVTGVTAEYADGTPVPASRIFPRRGTSPYFNAKERRLGMDYDIILKDGKTRETVHLDGSIDFEKNILNYLNVSAPPEVTITKVKFHAYASHEEHLRPITTGARNQFTEFMIPTRPHIEVSMPEETRTDINNGTHHLSNTDIISFMTEQIAVISSRMEDERLCEELENGHKWEANFSFEAPNKYAHGNLEWFNREFVPFLDQTALKMKAQYNLEDCHFRAVVSPYILRIFEPDYSLDKTATEDAKGSGPINYSIAVKTSTAVFYLISSLRQPVNQMRIVMQPNQYKLAPVRSYDYYRYTSFLTDKIRRSDNPLFEAITYAERNLAVPFTRLQEVVTIDDMYIMNTQGKNSFRCVDELGDVNDKNTSAITIENP